MGPRINSTKASLLVKPGRSNDCSSAQQRPTRTRATHNSILPEKQGESRSIFRMSNVKASRCCVSKSPEEESRASKIISIVDLGEEVISGPW